MTDQAPAPVAAPEAPGAAKVIEAESKAVRVTLFEDRAEVLRTAEARVPAGLSWLRLSEIATMVDDPTVIGNVRGDGARVLACRVTRRVRQVPACPKEEVAGAEAGFRAAVARRVTAERTLEAESAAEARCTALLEAWIAALKRVPREANATISGWRTSYQLLMEAEAKALDAVAAARSELSAARLDEQRATLRQKQAQRLQPRYEAAIELQIESAAAQAVSVEVSYRTPCALWRPEHLFRLSSREDGGAQIAITTYASVWQRTGEDWREVQLRFSTARPAQTATPPLLSEDNLRLRRKTDAERQRVIVEARDQSIAVAGLSRGQSSVEDMPGVDDGGEPLSFESARPASVPSTGLPTRVEIGTVTVPAQLERVVYPERTAAAHFRATATLAGPRPLLAGPVHLVRGSELVGRGRIGYVGRGEPFEIGFGTDDGIRVRRQLEDQRETTPVVGTQKLTRTVKLFVSNLSGSRKRLLLTERVPVSELRDLEVAMLQSSGCRFDPKDGFAHFDLELEPRAVRELSLSFRIEAGSRVVLPPL